MSPKDWDYTSGESAQQEFDRQFKGRKFKAQWDVGNQSVSPLTNIMNANPGISQELVEQMIAEYGF